MKLRNDIRLFIIHDCTKVFSAVTEPKEAFEIAEELLNDGIPAEVSFGIQEYGKKCFEREKAQQSLTLTVAKQYNEKLRKQIEALR